MADTAGVEFEGLQTVMTRIKAIPTNLTRSTENEIYDTVTDIFNESQKQVPVDRGFLRGSGATVVLSTDPLDITIGYGGVTAGYALAVHENLTAKHKGGTKAKYLEDPFNEQTAKLDERVAATIDGAVIGQMPGATSVAQSGEMGGMAKIAKAGRKRHAATHFTKPRPMSKADIHRAMTAIDKGTTRSGSWHRAGANRP